MPIDEPQSWEYSCTIPSPGQPAVFLPLTAQARTDSALSPLSRASVRVSQGLDRVRRAPNLSLVDGQVPPVLGVFCSSGGHALRPMRGRHPRRRVARVMILMTCHALAHLALAAKRVASHTRRGTTRTISLSLSSAHPVRGQCGRERLTARRDGLVKQVGGRIKGNSPISAHLPSKRRSTPGGQNASDA